MSLFHEWLQKHSGHNIKVDFVERDKLYHIFIYCKDCNVGDDFPYFK